jgi:hypothetical protein
MSSAMNVPKAPAGGDDSEGPAVTAPVAKKPSAGAADAVNMIQVGMGGPITEHEPATPGGPPIGVPKPAPQVAQTQTRSSATYTDEFGRQRPVSALTADTEGVVAKPTATVEKPYSPKESKSPSGGVGYDLSGLQGDKAKPEAFGVFDRPRGGGGAKPAQVQQKPSMARQAQPISQQQSNRIIAAMGSVPGEQTFKRDIEKRQFLHESEVKKYIEDISTPATCLLFLCMDEWGTDLTTWEPDTLPYAASVAWNAEIPQINRDKIWALVTHLTTDSFYSNLEAFIHICGALSGRGVDFEQYDPVEVDELCWGITETFLLAPMEKNEQFNEEILTYIEQRLEYEGFQKVPHMLRKFVKIPAREEELNQVLTGDGIGFENYWKMQESRLANIDIWVKERLAALFMTLENLPLRFANEQGLKRICERVRAALGSQSSLKREVEAASR